MGAGKQQQARPGDSLQVAARRRDELKDYWGEKGYAILAEVVPIDNTVSPRNRRYKVVTNLKNGCPPGYLEDMHRKRKIDERRRRDERAW